MARLIFPLLVLLTLISSLFFYFQEDNELREVDHRDVGAVAENVAEKAVSSVTVPGNKAGAAAVNEYVGPLVLRASAEPLPGKGMPITLAGLDELILNDPVALYIPQEDSVYQGRIEDVRATASGNRVLVGKLDGKHRFLFTIGPEQTFGTLYTREGRYQLETRDGTGRMVTAAQVNENLDYSKPDYVLPPPKQAPVEDKP